jgi:hypothetical protein
MKKWGTKSKIGGGVIFTTIVVDTIFGLYPNLLVVSEVTGQILIFTCIYDGYKNKNSK